MAIVTRKAKVTLNYLDEKPTVWKVQQVTMPQIGFDDLADEIAARCGVAQAQTKAVITGLVDAVGMYLKVGHPVKLGSLGTLAPRINVKCAKNAKGADLESIKRLKVQFISGNSLRSSVKSGGIRQNELLNEEE